MTVRQREERFVEETFTQLSSQTRAALDDLVKRQMPENDGDAEQRTLFPIRSDLAVIKEGAGALAVCYTLLAALCCQREREITDDLVELLIHIAPHVGVRAEEKVNAELMKYVKKVMGNSGI